MQSRRRLYIAVLALHSVFAVGFVLAGLLLPYDAEAPGGAAGVAAVLVAGAVLSLAAVASVTMWRHVSQPPPKDPWLWSVLAWPLGSLLLNITQPPSESMLISTTGYANDLVYLTAPLPRSLVVIALGLAAVTTIASLALRRTER